MHYEERQFSEKQGRHFSLSHTQMALTSCSKQGANGFLSSVICAINGP
jgi:hypothetical protein